MSALELPNKILSLLTEISGAATTKYLSAKTTSSVNVITPNLKFEDIDQRGRVVLFICACCTKASRIWERPTRVFCRALRSHLHLHSQPLIPAVPADGGSGFQQDAGTAAVSHRPPVWDRDREGNRSTSRTFAPGQLMSPVRISVGVGGRRPVGCPIRPVKAPPAALAVVAVQEGEDG